MIKELEKNIEEEILRIKLEVLTYVRKIISSELKEELEAAKCVN